MKRLACVTLLFLAALIAPRGALGQSVTFTASNISAGGSKLASGKLCAIPVDASNHPYPDGALGGPGGALTSSPVCSTVTSGAVTAMAFPDTALTTPKYLCLRVTVTDASGKPIYVNPCVQPASDGTQSWCTTAAGVTTCNFDRYIPVAAAIAPVIAPSLAIGTVTTGSPGSSAAASIAGPAPNYSLSLTLPTGAPGPNCSAISPPGTCDMQAVALTDLLSVSAGTVTPYTGKTWHAFGDSITFGFNASPASFNYVNRIATARGWTVTNHGTAGDKLVQMLDKVYTVTPDANHVYTSLIGQNDGCSIDAANLDAVGGPWTNVYEAGIAYLLTPNHVTGQSANALKTGAWTNSDITGFGVKSSTAGDHLSFSTYGTDAYVTLMATQGNASVVTISNSETLATTVVTPATFAGTYTTWAHYPLLIPLHFATVNKRTITVTITTADASHPVYFDWGGTASDLGATMFIASPYMTTGVDDTYFLGQCDRKVRRVWSDLAQDGLKVHYVNVRGACYNGTFGSLCNASDGTHPDNTGHGIIANAFLAVMDNVKWSVPATVDPKNLGAATADSLTSGTVTSTTSSTTNGSAAVRSLIGPGNRYLQEQNLAVNLAASQQADITLTLAGGSYGPYIAGTIDVDVGYNSPCHATYSAAGTAGDSWHVDMVHQSPSCVVILGNATTADTTHVTFSIVNLSATKAPLSLVTFHLGNAGTGANPVTAISAGTAYPATLTTPTYAQLATGRFCKADASGAITGNGADQTVASCVIPAKTIRAGECGKIEVYFQHNGSGNVTYKWVFGATTISIGPAVSASTNMGASLLFCNASGVTNSQKLIPSPLYSGVGIAAASATSTSSTDMTGAVTVNFTMSVTSPDTVTPNQMLGFRHPSQ